MVIRIHYLVLITLLSTKVLAQIPDPYDPFDLNTNSFEVEAEDPDQYKSAEELVMEAFNLQRDDRLLDARTKLLKALKKDPKDFKAYLALADYYQQHVGHFRLAMKYIMQGKKLFETNYGRPPYQNLYSQQVHMDILQLLSQIRLNLDNYQGALDTLNELESHGYYSQWLPASKAWILMKLGRLDEAIRVARMGSLLGANPGPTLNILGILLSMKGERQASLKVFEKAINYELSLGSMGRPATPLNNAGEVLKEIFEDQRAKRFWVRAVRLPDGCEHVLPSLNLALLRISGLDYQGAKHAIDNFESCVAQYPLKNGEEHRALVHLARGRIAMHTGDTDQAVEHFESARERQQWFGKIGTSQEDLLVAVLVSQAQALRYKNNQLKSSWSTSTLDWLAKIKNRFQNWIQQWWLMRRARQVTTSELNSLEDLHIRNTDSMLEYSTLGSFLAGFPTSVLQARIQKELEEDPRAIAKIYYQAYLGENMLINGNKRDGIDNLMQARLSARKGTDRLLRVHTGNILLNKLPTQSIKYQELAADIFKNSPAAIRLYGKQLPVSMTNLSAEAQKALAGTNFIKSESEEFSIQQSKFGELHQLQFNSSNSSIGKVTVRAETLKEAANKLSENVFSIKVS